MNEVWIVDAVRTPVGRRHGGLAQAHAVDLSAHVLRTLSSRTGVAPDLVEDVIWGCVSQVGDQSSNIGRYAVLAAGWPTSVPGMTINRACGSSQQAIECAAHSILAGQANVIVAGGVEVMSQTPLGIARQTGFPYGPTARERFDNFDFNQGESGELICDKWGLARQELDEFASQSHAKGVDAVESGAFETQLVPVPVGDIIVEKDEGLRPGTSVESLSKLKPSFRPDGRLHAGNSSQISDAAAAILLVSSECGRELGLKPMARYLGGAVVGSDPRLMLTGPIPATARVLKKLGLTVSDIGVFEINEAFASVPLAWLAEFPEAGNRLNPQGGAIAFGHPLGASGAILMTRMLHHMQSQGIRLGLQSMCEGGGTANATVIELLPT